jgi:ankyrin repeat protein
MTTMPTNAFYDLVSAVKTGHAADVHALLKKGAQPNVLGYSMRRGEGRISALAIAIERTDTAIIHLLLAHGANVHDIDHVYSAPAPIGATTSALHFLCGVPMPASEWCAIAQLLLEHGVQIGARNRAGLSALQLCTGADMDECRSFLVDAGAGVRVAAVGRVN